MNRLESFLKSVLPKTADKTEEKSANKTDKEIIKETTDKKLSNTVTTQLKSQNAETTSAAKPLPPLPNIPINGQAAHPRGSVLANEVCVPKLTGNSAKPLPEKPPSIKPYSKEQLTAMEGIATANKKKNELQSKREELETKINYSKTQDPNDLKQLSQIKLNEKKAEIELKQASLELLKANPNPNEKQINEYRNNITKLNIEYQKGYISYLLPSIKEKMENLKNLSPEERKSDAALQDLAYIEKFKTLVGNCNQLEKAYNVRNTSIGVLDGQPGSVPENIQKNAPPEPLAERAKPILPNMQRAGRAALSETPSEPLSQPSSTIGPPPNRPVPEIPTQVPTQLAAKVEDVVAPVVQNIASQKIEAEKTNAAEAPKIDTTAKTPEQKFYIDLKNTLGEVYSTEKTYHSQLTVLNELREHFDEKTIKKLAKQSDNKELFTEAFNDLLNNAQVMSKFSNDFVKTLEHYETELKKPELTESQRNEIILKYSEALANQKIPPDVVKATSNYIIAFEKFSSFFPAKADPGHPLKSAWDNEINSFKSNLPQQKINSSLYGEATFGSPNGPFIFAIQRFPRYAILGLELSKLSQKNENPRLARINEFENHIKTEASHLNDQIKLVQAKNLQTAIGSMGKTGGLTMENTVFSAAKRKVETRTYEKLGFESKTKSNEIETYQTAQKLLTELNKSSLEKIVDLKKTVQSDPKNDIAKTELFTLTERNESFEKSLRDLQNSTWGKRIQNTMTDSGENKEVKKHNQQIGELNQQITELKQQLSDLKKNINLHDIPPPPNFVILNEFSAFKTISDDKQKIIERKFDNFQKQVASFENIIKISETLTGHEKKIFIQANLNTLQEAAKDISQFIETTEKDFRGPNGRDKTDFDEKFLDLKNKTTDGIKNVQDKLLDQSLTETNFKSFWSQLVSNQQTDSQAKTDFLNTYRLFIKDLKIDNQPIPGDLKSEKLFNLLTERFKFGSEDEKLQIISLANQWLSSSHINSGDLKETKVQKAIENLFHETQKSDNPEIKSFNPSPEIKKALRINIETPLISGKQPLDGIIREIALGDYKSKDYQNLVSSLANDLTTVSKYHMSQLNNGNINDYDPVKNPKGPLQDLTKHYTSISNLVHETICAQTNKKENIKTATDEGIRTLEFFMDVQNKMLNDKPPDVNGAFAIYVGLNQTGIERLTNSSTFSSSKYGKMFKDNEKLFNNTSNYANLREFCNKSPGTIFLLSQLLSEVTLSKENDMITNSQLDKKTIDISLKLLNNFNSMLEMDPEKTKLQFDTQALFNKMHQANLNEYLLSKGLDGQAAVPDAYLVDLARSKFPKEVPKVKEQ